MINFEYEKVLDKIEMVLTGILLTTDFMDPYEEDWQDRYK